MVLAGGLRGTLSRDNQTINAALDALGRNWASRGDARSFPVGACFHDKQWRVGKSHSTYGEPTLTSCVVEALMIRLRATDISQSHVQTINLLPNTALTPS